MFLLVSVRHIGAHPNGHQHGVSIQISINLGKTFLRISRTRFWTLSIGSFDFYFDLFWMVWHWKPAIVNPLLSYYIVFTSRPFWLLLVPSISHWNMLYFQESQLFMYTTYCLLSWASNIGSCERSPDGCFGSTTNSVENKTQCQGALHRRGCGINCGCGGIVRNYIFPDTLP